jgi:hypothetical protein
MNVDLDWAVTTFKQSAVMMFGLDYDRSDLIEMLDEAEVLAQPAVEGTCEEIGDSHAS